MRTDSEKVTGTLVRDYDGKTDLTPFIRRANLIVNRVANLAIQRSMPLVPDELTDLETLLACHFYQASDPALQQKSTDNASGQFLGQTGKGFESTRYGLDALRLDWSGSLEAIDKRKVAKAFWGGTKPAFGPTAPDPGPGAGPV
jgi:hypothetical protein